MGVEALEKCDECNLLVLDLMMPKMNGVQVLAAPEGRERPVDSVITAQRKSDTEGMNFDGVHTILWKPFDIAELIAMLREVSEMIAPPSNG